MIPENRNKRGERSLANSRINRNGLRSGQTAPVFCLPRLDGTLLSLEEYGDQRVLLVFSDPNCGPCDQLAPQLEQLHRRTTNLHVLMISRGTSEVNLAKAAAHQLTFPIVLQEQWKISREYGIFATPAGYLIEQGIISANVALGCEAIIAVATEREEFMREEMQKRLEALRKELETGRGEIENVERRRQYLNETLLRISGAAQVLEELLAKNRSSGQNGVGIGQKQIDSVQAYPANAPLADQMSHSLEPPGEVMSHESSIGATSGL